jgi:hypothetical protein
MFFIKEYNSIIKFDLIFLNFQLKNLLNNY